MAQRAPSERKRERGLCRAVLSVPAWPPIPYTAPYDPPKARCIGWQRSLSSVPGQGRRALPYRCGLETLASLTMAWLRPR